MTNTEHQSVELEPQLIVPRVKRWGAAHTLSRAEKCFAEYLRERAVPHFLPLVKHRNVGNREIRYFHVPLFPGYVFFDADAISRPDAFASRKIANILYADEPELLQSQLENLSRALQVDRFLCQFRYGEAGTPVRVARGKLRGICGEVIRVEGRTRLLIRVSFIGQAASLNIDEAMVEADPVS